MIVNPRSAGGGGEQVSPPPATRMWLRPPAVGGLNMLELKLLPIVLFNCST